MRYQCQRCGNCCRWPGFVRLADGEADRIAEFLGIGVRDFIGESTELLAGRDALGIKSLPTGECLFLDGKNVCRIQAVKPRQCEGFPNAWNFPGWREVCEAVEISAPGEDAKD